MRLGNNKSLSLEFTNLVAQAPNRNPQDPRSLGPVAADVEQGLNNEGTFNVFERVTDDLTGHEILDCLF
jgi:hypothetical protein